MPRHESTLGATSLAFAKEADVDTFIDTLEKFERGEIDADTWRTFRLVNGTYGQRQVGDLSMLRVKIPQGVLSTDQARVLADTAEKWSRGFFHLTTRQNAQLHFVHLSDVGTAMQHLAAAGLTTREACGNSVRNITCAWSAGVDSTEAFDPTPYSQALTRYLLRHPLSSTLPRKFKIAFAGGPTDHAFALVNDIGFWPKIVGGKRVFGITLAGGTSTLCRAGHEIFDALPAEQILALSEAVIRVFHAHGDRVHRARNRMKFLVKQLGWDAFAQLVVDEYAKVGDVDLPFDAQNPPPFESQPTSYTAEPSASQLREIVSHARWDEPRPPTPPTIKLAESEAKARWLRTNVKPQRQAGYSLVIVTLSLGDVSGAHLRALALLAESFGDATLRTTHGQDLTLRWVPNDRVGSLYDLLLAIGMNRSDPDSLGDVTSCPGAESCKLAVTRSRGVAGLLNEHFSVHTELLDRVGPLDVRVSGCPNGCGLHHVAGIGLQGGLRKVDGKPAPQYFVYLGGDPRPEAATFGRLVAKVPARRAGEAIERLVRHYVENREAGEQAAAFFARVEVPKVKALLVDLETLTPELVRPDDFVDLGDTQSFREETMEGECAS
ncbi:MAG: nitrite/sulfite reductase [Polyangia bacterium]